MNLKQLEEKIALARAKGATDETDVGIAENVAPNQSYIEAWLSSDKSLFIVFSDDAEPHEMRGRL